MQIKVEEKGLLWSSCAIGKARNNSHNSFLWARWFLCEVDKLADVCLSSLGFFAVQYKNINFLFSQLCPFG